MEKVAKAATAAFLRLMGARDQRTVMGADGRRVKLRNHTYRSFGAQVRHLVSENTASRGQAMNLLKAEWLPMIEETLTQAQVVLDGPKGRKEEGRGYYIRRYERAGTPGIDHVVVTSAEGEVEDQYLITQFPSIINKSQRHWDFPVRWLRGTTQTQESGQPHSPGSTVLGPRRGAATDDSAVSNDTTPDAGAQEG